MRVLVTGGAGFIGSHVVDKLLAAGHEPRIFDLRPSSYHSGTEVETVVGSLEDPTALARAMAGCDAVIHLAAVADVGQVDVDPAGAERINVRGTWHVLDCARGAGVRRVVYGSTVWVYGDCPRDEVDEDTPLASPSHLYTATKLAGELYCRSCAERNAIEYTILRFGIPYGPRAREAAVVPRMVARALAGEPLEVAGTGEQTRPFVYVEDLAEGIVRALAPQAANRVYNLASQPSTPILALVEAVRDLVGGAEIVHREGRPGDFAGKRICCRRAEEELGWRAVTPLEEGIRRYLAWRTGALESSADAPGRRVLILTADIGEGHDLPARVIAARTRAENPGAQVKVLDGLEVLGRFSRFVVRDGSDLFFRVAPWAFELPYALLSRIPPTRRLLQKAFALIGARRLLRAIRRHDSDVVVSTYPGVTALLGELRLSGRLQVPAVSAITDLAGLQWWAHPGIDVHTVIHEESIEEVERIAGPGSAVWAQPPTSPDFLGPRPRAAARRSLDLPTDEPVILISGGGWAIGDLEGATREALKVEGATVVCLCGRSERVRRRLARRLGAERRVRVLGFTDRMSDLLAAADVLIHSTAGQTVLEAQIRGCRVISYGFGVGHVRLNNRAYNRFGLAEVVRSRRGLLPALRRALAEPRVPDPAFSALPSPASVVLSARERVRPWPVWRVRTAHALTIGAASLAVVTWGFASDDPYGLAARALGWHPLTEVATSDRAVGVLVEGPPGSVPAAARALAGSDAEASFALGPQADPSTLRLLDRLGDQAVPEITTHGLVGWIKTRSDLKHQAQRLGLSKHFMFASSSRGLTIGKYLLAHSAGGKPIAGAVQWSGGTLPDLRPGEVVEVQLSPSTRATARQIESVVDQSRRQGLGVVSVGDLLRRGD